MRKSAIAVALLALALLAGCGSDDTSSAPTTSVAATSISVSGKPGATTPGASTPPGGASPTSGATPSGGALSAAEISKNLQDKGQMDAQTADCIAKIYVEENLSQNALRKILETDSAGNPLITGLTADDLRKAGTAAKRVVLECHK
ncbi:hypothetical protein [Nocardia jejuensis]|uniref:hypothetical protein n=1 Tax=Nocardia jejuensis TaxID=328049 RepID=UPI00083245B6|nr:hypothetical protein [Nocardia jejuensis]